MGTDMARSTWLVIYQEYIYFKGSEERIYVLYGVGNANIYTLWGRKRVYILYGVGNASVCYILYGVGNDSFYLLHYTLWDRKRFLLLYGVGNASFYLLDTFRRIVYHFILRVTGTTVTVIIDSYLKGATLFKRVRNAKTLTPTPRSVFKSFLYFIILYLVVHICSVIRMCDYIDEHRK